MNNDLISRNELKEDLIKFFPTDCLDGIEPKTLFNQILTDIDNAPTVEYPFYAEAHQTGYADGTADEYHAIMDILNRCGVTVCMEDKKLLTIAEYVEMKERGEL